MSDSALARPDARSFVQCWKEVSSMASSQSPASSDELVELGVRHYATLYQIAEELNLTPEDPNDQFIIRQLSLSLAACPLDGLGTAEISETVSQLHKNITEDGEWLSLFSDSENTESLIASIRVSLLSATLSLGKLSKLIGVSDENQKILFSWLQNSSIHLAQDLAFNWSELSEYHERECLFSGTLRECSQFVLGAWVEAVSSTPSTLPAITESSIWLSLPALEQEILDQGMGYESHPEYDYSWLKKEVGEYIYSSLCAQPWRSADSPGNIRCRLDADFIRQIEDISIHAWRESCESMLSRISEMTEPEMDAWMQSTEGQKPMSLDLFYRECHSLLEVHGPIKPILAVDLESASNIARDKLAAAWGISDSIFNIDNEEE